mmetsp:Transcript_119975/g.188208  ORF Transcript_119975/g.188208 Transcript_119975/m.188208 type:complete len:107 (-) Transcript_119975:54-374(-)
MSFSLAPHPVGIKFYTSIWRANKDLPYSEIHAGFQNWYSHAFHRSFGKYFYNHRAGPVGTFAPLVVFGLGLKVFAMFYGTQRDLAAAEAAALAYGQSGYKVNPVPK